MNLRSKTAFSIGVLCICYTMLFLNIPVFAQKADSTKVSFKPKSKVVSRIPQIKANIQPYRPSQFSYTSPTGMLASSSPKNAKILTILKVYPNPVNDQININLRLDKETMLTIKITDLLSNDVITLLNERTPAGEQTKTFTIPNKLNTGMYFLRIVAGGEPKVMRISVL